MAEEIKDIYYYLNDIWEKYDDFDKPVEKDRYYHKYIPICNLIVNEPHEDIYKQKNFCMKLVRNLGHHSDTYDFLKFNPELCYDLNNWIYNSMIKHSIPKSIITKSFIEYYGTVSGMKQEPTCLYYEYDNTYKEPMKIIILNIFESNIHIIKKKLESETKLIRCYCQEFVKKIVEIYKYMKKEHCSNDQIVPKTETCKLLDKFKISYGYLYDDEKINKNIPSLENSNIAILSDCDSDKSPLRAQLAESLKIHEPVDDDQEFKSAKDYNSPITSETTHETSPMSRTVSTAIGTVAGTSSLLAMLYKVNKKYY
ncbi:hypothetical protein PVNG_02205 [Plasmodium vivax North Korean]|uniref:Variable surface protein n=1 Tax=Plasmodium vivax North Korean TaxID=1035514 RepID=A0A0J9TWY0_PLAVI|nr:hypothetical protein PVNG_02205 [Plasmodium vivax North Korean]